MRHVMLSNSSKINPYNPYNPCLLNNDYLFQDMYCYQKSFANPTEPVDEARFYALVRAAKWNEIIDKYRNIGDAALKRKLPAFIFQATFDETVSKKGKLGAWRKQAATCLTGLVVMDIDHVENPLEVMEGWKTRLDLESLGIVLIYVTPSGKGLKVVFKARLEWGNLIDNQHAMAKLLGVEVDEACKDASRMSFICKEEDIQLIDKELFTYENKEFAEKYNDDYRTGRSAATRTAVETHSAAAQGAAAPEPLDAEEVAQLSFKGIPYSSIIAEWFRQQGGEPVEGERNTSLHRLATHLRTICDNRQDLLLQIMPRYGLDELEMKSIIASATKDQPKGKTREIRAVLAKLGNEESGTSNEESSEANKNEAHLLEQRAQDQVLNFQLQKWGGEIAELSEHFPILRDVCKGLKLNQYPAALFVGGGLLMTLMTRCTYRFYHRPEELRRLNNSTLIIGDPASGKSFATRLFKLLAAPIVAADKVGKEAINAYRELTRTKGANKEKPKKPKVVVRLHPARTSNAQFIQDMVNAVEMVDGEEMQLHMLTFDTELDNTLTVQKGGSWIDKQSLQLKAFHNEEDGQAYSNVDSILQDFYVVWNFIYTGTPIALKKMVNEQNFGSGLATRLTCIPLPSTNFEMMSRERMVDHESDNRLKEWAFKLDKTKGELPVQRIVDELYDWTARRMEDAKDNESKADEMLLKRCAYHGLNFAAPFIVMRHWEELRQEGDYYCGEFETDETDWKLAELIVNMQYACQKHYFGAMAEHYFDNKLRDAHVNLQRRQKTIEAFNQLPDEFTNEDVMKCFSLSTNDAARVKTNRLCRDHLVEKTGEFKENGVIKFIYRKTGTLML